VSWACVAGSAASIADEPDLSDVRGLPMASDGEPACGGRSLPGAPVAGGASSGAAPELARGPSMCGAGVRCPRRSGDVCCPSATCTTLPGGSDRRGAWITSDMSWEPGRRTVTATPYAVRMPRYDYRCRACGDTFEMNRPMAEASAPASCPRGHADTVKLLSTVAITGRGAAMPSSPSGGGGAGGGCCGGACGC